MVKTRFALSICAGSLICNGQLLAGMFLLIALIIWTFEEQSNETK